MTSESHGARPPLRVVLLAMTWFAEDPGGLNRYALELSRALREHGVAVEGVVVGSPPLGSGFVGPVSAEASMPRRLLAMATEGRARSRGADVLNSHFALYALPVVLTSRRRPHVVHFHGPWHLETVVESKATWPKTALRKAVESYVYRRADELVVLSKEFGQILIDDFGVLPARVHVIAPGVDLDGFSPWDSAEARRHLGLPLDDTAVLSSRRLARRMGLDVLIRAWARSRVSRATLYLLGSGPLGGELQQLAADLDVESSVKFVGFVPDADLPLWYSAADFSVVPSDALEGFGLSVLESLACGTPVLASQIGGMAEVLPDLAPGLLVAAGDVLALSQAVSSALQHPDFFPDAKTCRIFAESFTWSVAAERITDVYERARRRPPDRPYRVVFLDHCARLSGGELALLRLLTAESNIEPHVILGEDGPLRDRLLALGVYCEVLRFSSEASSLHRDQLGHASTLAAGGAATASQVARLARRLRQLRPDLVHTNSLKAGVYGAMAARSAAIPVVWHLRDRIDHVAYPARVASAVRWFAGTIPNAIIANSRSTAEPMRGMRVPVHVVPSPIDLRPVHPPSERPLMVGIVGRLAPWKGQHVFLDAVAELVGRYPTLRGRVIGAALFGEDSYAEQLRGQVRDLDIADRIDFVGFREDVAVELAQLTVVVHASIQAEPFGQVVVEAMAAGVPVVATAAGGPAEVVTNGVNGLLVAPGDAHVLAAAIDQLLADPPLRSRLARAGQSTAAQYRPDRVAAQVEAVYAAVLDSHSRRTH